jgi:hypothetical protein
MSDDELVIDESNFSEYFFDSRRHKIQKGQVLACYSAKADWVDSNEKANVVDLLINYDTKVEPAIQVMGSGTRLVERHDQRRSFEEALQINR